VGLKCSGSKTGVPVLTRTLWNMSKGGDWEFVLASKLSGSGVLSRRIVSSTLEAREIGVR
jgi:hypothetical protein